MRSQWLGKYAWPRFALTTLLVAIVLTAIADAQPGRHNAPVWDWIFIGVCVAAIRLASRYGIRAIRRRRTGRARQRASSSELDGARTGPAGAAAEQAWRVEASPGEASELVGVPRAKVCPDCAEEVKAQAKKCRFCGYRFEPTGSPNVGGAGPTI